MIEEHIKEMNRLGYALNIYEYSGKYAATREPHMRWDCTAYGADGKMSHFGFGPTAEDAVLSCLIKSRDIHAGKPVQRRGAIDDPRKRVVGISPKNILGGATAQSDPFGEDEPETDAFE